MTENCIHCGACTKKCTFLQKYGMDLSAFALHSELAYHCFLCRECSRVCPKGIDGRSISLAMRRARAEVNSGKPAEKGYGALVAEKENYLFKNYRGAAGKTVLFPGCNFPSFFPKTTDVLIHILKGAGIGTIFDCCGKPIGDLGLADKEARGAAALQARLINAGIERLVVLCPNCYYYLKSHITMDVISIYELLRDLNLGAIISEEIPLFLPCPDRDERILLEDLTYFIPHAVPIEDIACCGLGGCAASKEPEIAASFADELRDRYSNAYTYCASCAGQFRRNGAEHATHILTKILGTDEEPVLSGAKTLWNRAKRIF